MKFGLILSLDYEIFGNGKGSVLKHIFEPTSNILKICDENGFKLTIMFEVCEYWAFKAAENRGDLNHLDYSPSGIMEEQIRKALSSGHDVQLHTHPQWLNSKLINNNWILDFNQWKLSDLPYSNESNDGNYSILSVLGEGKKTLENILQNVDKSYKCIAYRAGSWCIQPEEEIIKAMKNVDIRIDSSVFKDGKSSGLSSYNYEQAPYSIGYWWTNSKDVCKIDSSKKNIMEVPIQTMNMPFYKNYKLKKFYSLIKSKISSRSDGGNSGMSNSSILTNPFSPYPFKFDFCKLNLNQMIDFIDEAKKSPCYQNEGVIPIVSIGHSKDFFNERDLSRFLSHLSTHHKDSVIPFTFSDLFKSVAWEGLDS